MNNKLDSSYNIDLSSPAFLSQHGQLSLRVKQDLEYINSIIK